MKTRRVAVAATVTLAVASLAACSTPAAPANTSGAGTLTVASIPNYQTSLTELITEFEAANPDIDVQEQFIDVASYHTTLRTQLSAGTAPDVFSVFPGNGTPTAMEVLQPAGYLADLSGLAFNDSVPSGLDSTTEVDGTRYIMPYALGAIGTIYNEQAVEAAGVTLPTTWTGVLEYCDAAKAAGKVAFAYGAQTPFVNQLIDYALTATLVYGEDPDFDADQAAGKATFADSNWSEAMEKLIEMRDRGCFQDSPLGTSYETAIDMVAKGDALSMVSVVSTLGALAAAAPDGTTFGLQALPANDNKDPNATWMPAGAGGAYGINAKAKNPTAAEKFIDFLSTTQSQATMSEVQGAPPANLDGWEAPASMTSIVDHVNAGTVHPYADQLWPNAKVADAHMAGVQQIMGDQGTIPDVLAAMDAAYAEGSK
jgi:raffinose/stachyose/melibiose transport system substrate-binding protein